MIVVQLNLLDSRTCLGTRSLTLITSSVRTTEPKHGIWFGRRVSPAKSFREGFVYSAGWWLSA